MEGDLLLDLRKFVLRVGQERRLGFRIPFEDVDPDLQMVALLEQAVEPNIPELLPQEARLSPHVASRARPR